ncbi:MAG: insulinase family protein [Alphaproteobacteria bacterium]|nr:insulinase family protein [Alphaproteobacteria bacterium]
MEKFQLENGLSVMYAGLAKKFSVCVSINVGHVNEPKLGIANLFERTLLLQTCGIVPVFGGTMTAYTTGGDSLDEVLAKARKIFCDTVVTPEYLERAKELICAQTYDMAPMTMRRMKLAYKHVAFGADLVRPTEEYLGAINSYTVEDVREFANTYYTGSNIVLVVSGPNVSDLELEKLADEYFGDIPRGVEAPRAKSNIYTGGFDKIDVTNKTTRLMFGWDMSALSIDDSAATNVMMSMFLRRLERAYADKGYDDVQVDLKIAGYYGLRTIRAYVSSSTLNAKELTDIFVSAVNRISDTEASDRRMERSRNEAMVEKLDKYEKSDDRALETAWQLIGRGSMYDVANRINSIFETRAEDVRDIARRVFRGSRPTYIVALPDGSSYYTLDELMAALKIKL